MLTALALYIFAVGIQSSDWYHWVSHFKMHVFVLHDRAPIVCLAGNIAFEYSAVPL